MIKKVKIIKTINDKFQLPVDLIQLSPAINNSEYIIGGFYKNEGYKMLAFFESDQEGNILNNEAIIKEEGINNYSEVFAKLGYTII